MSECPHIDRSLANEQIFGEVHLHGYVYFKSRISNRSVQFCRIVRGSVDYPDLCADEGLAKRNCPWYSRGVLEEK